MRLRPFICALVSIVYVSFSQGTFAQSKFARTLLYRPLEGEHRELSINNSAFFSLLQDTYVSSLIYTGEVTYPLSLRYEWRNRAYDLRFDLQFVDMVFKHPLPIGESMGGYIVDFQVFAAKHYAMLNGFYFKLGTDLEFFSNIRRSFIGLDESLLSGEAWLGTHAYAYVGYLTRFLRGEIALGLPVLAYALGETFDQGITTLDPDDRPTISELVQDRGTDDVFPSTLSSFISGGRFLLPHRWIDIHLEANVAIIITSDIGLSLEYDFRYRHSENTIAVTQILQSIGLRISTYL